jgi:hypothetical protein
MNNVQFFHDIPIKPCYSEFWSKTDKKSLPQCLELSDLIKEYQCNDIGYLNGTDTHDLIVAIINNNFIDLTELSSCLIETARRSKKFFYIAINKFFVYSSVDYYNKYSSAVDYDYKLILFCVDIIGAEFKLIKHSYQENDVGTLGNFMHPITTMFFQKHE